jgi:hypothetical protein
VAVKEPHTQHLSEPLKGEDARALADYMTAPTLPEGHDAYLEASEQTLAKLYVSEPANERFL